MGGQRSQKRALDAGSGEGEEHLQKPAKKIQRQQLDEPDELEQPSSPEGDKEDEEEQGKIHSLFRTLVAPAHYYTDDSTTIELLEKRLERKKKALRQRQRSKCLHIQLTAM